MSEYRDGPEWGYCTETDCKEDAMPFWLSGDYPDEPDMLLCYKHIGSHVAKLRSALEHISDVNDADERHLSRSRARLVNLEAERDALNATIARAFDIAHEKRGTAASKVGRIAAELRSALEGAGE